MLWVLAPGCLLLTPVLEHRVADGALGVYVEPGEKFR